MRRFADGKSLKRLASCDRGAISLLFGFTLVIFVLLVGGAIDFALSLVSRSDMQTAGDTAVLSAAITPSGTSPTQVAERYYNVNYHSNSIAESSFKDASFQISGDHIRIDSKQQMRTSFLRSGDSEKQIGVGAVSEVGSSGSPPGKYDLILVLDVSGSMAKRDVGNPPHGEFPPQDGSACPDCRLAILYSSLMRFYDQVFAVSDPTERFSLSHITYGPYVMDKTMYPTRNQAVYFPEGRMDSENTRAGVNRYYNLRDFYAHNEEYGTVGGSATKRAYEMLMTHPKDKDVIPVVIIETDGQNTSPADDRPSPAEDAMQIEYCGKIKAAGAVVYTIAFGSDRFYAPEIRKVFSECASGSGADKSKYALEATTQLELNSVFDSIFTGVQKLRLTR